MERTICKVSQTPLGTIWEAGIISGGRDLPPGVFGLRRELGRFRAFFREFSSGFELTLAYFPATQEGEREARTFVLELWESYK